jgi:hypothetical protein
MCVGNPACPHGFEAEGDGCISEDKDGDGIPNGRDKCPDEPEDKNGFEDDDGCPDEARRVQALEAAAHAARDAASQKEHQRRVIEEEQAQQAAAAAELERQRERDEEARRKEGEEEQQKRAVDAARAEKARQDAVVHAATRRMFGLVLTGAGVAAGAGSLVFVALGSGENSAIKNGSLATGSAIANAASSGSTDNAVAIGLGITAAVGFGVGIPLFVSGLGGPADKPAPPTALAVVPLLHGAALSAVVPFL